MKRITKAHNLAAVMEAVARQGIIYSTFVLLPSQKVASMDIPFILFENSNGDIWFIKIVGFTHEWCYLYNRSELIHTPGLLG